MFNLQETLFVPGIIVCHLVGTSIPDTESVYELGLSTSLPTHVLGANIRRYVCGARWISVRLPDLNQIRNSGFDFAQFRLVMYEVLIVTLTERCIQNLNLLERRYNIESFQGLNRFNHLGIQTVGTNANQSKYTSKLQITI